MCKKKKEKQHTELPYLVVCAHMKTINDGFRIEYSTFEDAYRKFLHTVWYNHSMKERIPMVCTLFHNKQVVYNYSQNETGNQLTDCLDPSKSKDNITENELSKIILSAIIQYESAFSDNFHKEN